MSGRRRVKDIDYEDDEYDDQGFEDHGGEAEGISAQDREQLNLGTINVRERLGPDYSTVSDQAIQDALWHYYYDIDKSVIYLKNQATPQHVAKPKTPKTPSRFEQAAFSAAQNTPDVRPAFRHWFKDVSWTHLRQEQRGQGMVEQGRPRLTMRGGSTAAPVKMSKLAALAKARKQKQSETPASSPRPASTPSTSHNDAFTDTTVRNATPQKSTTQHSMAIRSSNPAESNSNTKITELPENTEAQNLRQDSKAPPSIFARIMCSDSSRSTGPIAHTNPHPQDVTTALASALFGHGQSTQSANVLTGPSPDDIVTKAQSKGFVKQDSNSKRPLASLKTNTKDQGSSSNIAFSDLQISATPTTPRAKRRKLDVAAEYEARKGKSEASFVVVGHVDHGKSTLMGRLLCDLKVVDQRSIDKYRVEASNMGKSSFALAWVMDSTAEERERGVTVDIATNSFETDKMKFTILDAPGHQDFIPNMIAGASQADFAVLVVDASTNGFEAGLRGQTKEHALLVRSTGVQRIVIAVNKMDAANWSEDRFDEIKQQMSAFLTAAGFQANRLAFVPCAGLTGDNVLKGLPSSASWYTGDTLVQALERYEPVKANISKPFRMSINDVFRGGVTYPLSVSGRLEAGSIQLDDDLICMPSSEKAIVKGLEVDNESVEWAVAGQITTIHLSDVDPIHIHAGDVLCDSSTPIANIREFTAKLLAFEHLLPSPIDIHRGRLHMPGKILRVEATLDKGTGEVVKKRPKIVQPGSVARVRVVLDSAVPLEAPSRIVLRADGSTIAAGLIESVHT